MKWLPLVFLLALAGCERKQQEPVAQPARSPISAMVDAEVWRLQSPTTRALGNVAATGSMKPCIDEYSIALLEKYVQGEPISLREVVVFDRGDGHVVHRVVGQTPTHVYTSGDNVRAPDGWYDKKAVLFRVVGQFYLPRP